MALFAEFFDSYSYTNNRLVLSKKITEYEQAEDKLSLY